MTLRAPDQLRADALRIWRAGVDAVASDRLVERAVHRRGHELIVDDLGIDLRAIRRIEVVGGGKAGAGMAAGLERALGTEILRAKQVSGWLNVPADCVRPLAAIHLHAGRPAGVNEPTVEGIAGAEEILRRVGELTADDLCVCLISGGASALLPAPAQGITLADKLAVTRHLSAAGANIAELNTVRKQLSRFKGGGLARACRAGLMVALVISDVLGDPLDLIASGPTVDDRSTAADALAILDRYGAQSGGISPAVFAFLENRRHAIRERPTCRVENIVIGNNALAVDAAGTMAESLGYSHAMVAARELEGLADDVGRHLAEMAIQMRDSVGPDCLISGGEPTVRLVPSNQRGLGGRNQQLVLAAVEALGMRDASRLVILSGGTDGEDGPTDAAGAWADAALIAEAHRRGFDAGDFCRRNDAYHYFAPLGGLIRTGPTHTNVCDLRVVCIEPSTQ